MRTIFLDGEYFKVELQFIEAFAPGVFKAKGVFETMLGLDGLVFDKACHLKRLRSGLKTLGVPLPAMNPAVLDETLRRNRLLCARVRMSVWQAGRDVHLMVTALPYDIPANPVYRVCLVKTPRTASARHSNVKSLDYEVFADALSQAKAQGFDEALLVNRKGYIFEASRANIFWIKDKVLYTTPLSSGCLNGITRQAVIRQARKFKILVKEINLTPEILQKADTAFLTNSLMGIRPIIFDF